MKSWSIYGQAGARSMVTGERARWEAAMFRRRDEMFLSYVVRVWQSAVAQLQRDPPENSITKALVERLDADGQARDFFYCDYQFVPIEWRNDGKMTEDQYIDLAMIVGNDRHAYLAYECKKLNVHGADGARRSQAGAYVRDGMMRFVTEQYAKDLPVGCMLGYVMDGDLRWAYARVVAAMMAQTPTLGLQGRPISAPSIGVIQRFVTQHERNNRSLEMRHALLPFVGSASAGAVA